MHLAEPYGFNYQQSVVLMQEIHQHPIRKASKSRKARGMNLSRITRLLLFMPLISGPPLLLLNRFTSLAPHALQQGAPPAHGRVNNSHSLNRTDGTA